MKRKIKRYCASCRDEGSKTKADYNAKGGILDKTGFRTVPYQAYLCKAHYETLLNDGVSLKIVEYVSELVQYELTLELIRKHTAFDDVEEFLRSTPTIHGFRGADWLRQFYLEKTGNRCSGYPSEYSPHFCEVCDMLQKEEL